MARIQQVLSERKAALSAKLKKVRRRRRIGVPVFTVIVALSVWAVIERDVFEGLLVLIAASGLLIGALGFLPNRPSLHVADSSGYGGIALQPPPVRPIDEDSVVGERERSCRNEMPRQPRAKFPPGHVLGGATVESVAEQTEHMHRMMGWPTDETLREHLDRVTKYGSELREWIEEFEEARAECLRAFNLGLRIYEQGHAATDHVDLILRFPEGFELEGELPEVDEPPEAPSFSSGIVFPGFSSAHAAAVSSAANRIVHGFKPQQRTDDEPRYSLEEGRPRVDYSLGHVNQSHYRPVPAFTLKAPKEPGTYEVAWELTADALPKAISGSLILEISAASGAEPITTLAEMREQGEGLGLL